MCERETVCVCMRKNAHPGNHAHTHGGAILHDNLTDIGAYEGATASPFDNGNQHFGHAVRPCALKPKKSIAQTNIRNECVDRNRKIHLNNMIVCTAALLPPQ